ncbi:hypothetical protein ABPG72_008513 [Tetrahymena utriculariae]
MFELTTVVIFFLQFLLVGACLYLIMCADPNSQGILGKAHRFVYKLIPSLYSSSKDTNKKTNIFFRIADKIINYLCYTNHPLVQIFYVIVAGGGFVVYCHFGLFKHFPNQQVSSIHIYVGSLFAFFCFYSYYLACKVSPGKICKENVKQYTKTYEKYYDDVLFEKGNNCSTCNIVKPARSKHCKTCNMCVAKFDHHCIWIRQCVGEKNYKYFLLFIGSHALLTLYGGIIGILCLYGIVLDSNLLHAKFRIPGSNEVIDANWSIILKYLFYKETMFVFIIILCIIMGITLTLFLLYHFSMVKDNMTTNERIKRSDFISFLEKETKKMEKDIDEPDQTAENKLEKQQKLKKYKRDLELLKKWFPTKGFKQNLRDIWNL